MNWFISKVLLKKRIVVKFQNALIKNKLYIKNINKKLKVFKKICK